MFDERFWLAIAFFTFVTAIIRYVAPIISKQLEDKSKQIASDLLAAKEAKEKAQKILQETEKKYQEALVFAQKVMKDSSDEAQKFLQEAQAASTAEIAKKMAALEARIKTEEEHAVREIKVSVINAAIKKVQENLQNMQKGNSENLIKKALDDVSKMVH